MLAGLVTISSQFCQNCGHHFDHLIVVVLLTSVSTLARRCLAELARKCAGRARKVHCQSSHGGALAELAKRCAGRARKEVRWQSSQGGALAELAGKCAGRARRDVRWQSRPGGLSGRPGCLSGRPGGLSAGRGACLVGLGVLGGRSPPTLDCWTVRVCVACARACVRVCVCACVFVSE